MNRRQFFSSLLATAALTTGLARATWTLAGGPGHEREAEIIALLQEKIRNAERMMREQIEQSIWSEGSSRYEYKRYGIAEAIAYDEESSSLYRYVEHSPVGIEVG